MSSSINYSDTASSSVESTSNPQSNIQANYQGNPSSLQNSSSSSNINNAPKGGNTVTINNFSLNALSLSAQTNYTVTPYNKQNSNNGLSPLAITVIIIVLIAGIGAAVLAGKANNITTKKVL